MAVKKKPKAPSFDRLILDHIEDADNAGLVEASEHDSLRYRDVDLSDSSLAAAHFSECEILGMEAGPGALRGIRIVDSLLDRVNAPVLVLSRSELRDVRIENSRIGSAEAYDSSWQAVHFIGCKIGYLNLRGATVRDLQFTDCTIEELDLGSARITRLAFDRSDLHALDITAATLVDADLRGIELGMLRGLEALSGATIAEDQFARLSPLFAAHFGVNITA